MSSSIVVHENIKDNEVINKRSVATMYKTGLAILSNIILNIKVKIKG